MRDIIIDCDPGHDDAIAIFMAVAHSNKLNLRAVTTVCGNNTLEKVTINAQHILDVVGADIPLAKGATRPLISDPIISDKYHGVTGMDGPTDLPTPVHPVCDNHAVELLRDLLLSTDKMTIVALAPLTNIALLLRMYPEVIPHIELISLMGGGLDGGNITEDAEFNIYVDPEAAQIVFSSGISIVMSGLDVTTKALIYPEEFMSLKEQSPTGKMFVELMEFYLKGAADFGTTGCMMHDPCAIAYLLAPEKFSGKKTDVEVLLAGEHRGKTVAIASDHPQTLVLTDVDVKEMSNLVIGSIEQLT